MADVCGRRPSGPRSSCVFRAEMYHCGVYLTKLMVIPTPCPAHRALKRFIRHYIVRHTRRVCSWMVIRLSYLTHSKTGYRYDDIRIPSIVIVIRQLYYALARLKISVSHFASLRVRRSSSLQLTTLSTSRCS